MKIVLITLVIAFVSGCASVQTNPLDHPTATGFAMAAGFEDIPFQDRSWKKPKIVESPNMRTIAFNVDIYGEYLLENLPKYCTTYGNVLYEGLEGLNALYQTERPAGFLEGLSQLSSFAESRRTLVDTQANTTQVGGEFTQFYCTSSSENPTEALRWIAFVMPRPAWRELGSFSSTDFSFLIIERRSTDYSAFILDAVKAMRAYHP